VADRLALIVIWLVLMHHRQAAATKHLGQLPIFHVDTGHEVISIYVYLCRTSRTHTHTHAYLFGDSVMCPVCTSAPSCPPSNAAPPTVAAGPGTCAEGSASSRLPSPIPART
jgi:hypothetical protein